MARRSLESLSVAEIRRIYVDEQRAPSAYIRARMGRDPRQGVRKIHAILTRRVAARRLEQRRLEKLLQLERDLWDQGRKAVAGVDEAGVGPLAGPVVAAAVIFRPGVTINRLDDSKNLDPETRRDLSREIREKAVSYAHGIAEVGEINRINVYQASLLAMRRAVHNLATQPDHLLIDARSLPDLFIPQDAVVGGDGRHFSIAAASILAKTHRDRLMARLDRDYPGYGLARHKGYSTPEHQQAISRLGPCPIHRTSYAFIDELTGAYSATFYQLKSELQSVSCSAELQVCREEFARSRGSLSQDEVRKLNLLINRRLKRYPPARQLKLGSGFWVLGSGFWAWHSLSLVPVARWWLLVTGYWLGT